MTEETRQLLTLWRAEVAAALVVAEAELEAARPALAEAIEADLSEGRRIADLVSVFERFPAKEHLGNALQARFREAVRRAPAAASRPQADLVETLKVRADDLHASLLQIDAMLRPPLVLVHSEEERQAATLGDGFDPIVMPAARFA